MPNLNKARCCSKRKLYAKGLCRSHYILDFPRIPIKRKSIKYLIVDWLVAKQRGICTQCLEPFIDLKDVHLDHIIPIILGGTDTITNMQVLHVECNLRKSGPRISHIAETQVAAIKL